MTVALEKNREIQQIHDRFEKLLDTAKDLPPTLPRINSYPKGYNPNPWGWIPPERKKWLAELDRNYIYYNSSPAMKVVWWIRYHPIAITATAVGVIASVGALYATYGR